MFSQNVLQKRYNIYEIKMPSRLKTGAAHFRVPGMAESQIGIDACPPQGHEPLSPGKPGATGGRLGWQMRRERPQEGRGPRGRHWEAPSRGGSVQTDDSGVNSMTHPAGLCCKLLFAFLIYFKQKSINSITICICWNVSWREETGAVRQSGVFPAPSDIAVALSPD